MHYNTLREQMFKKDSEMQFCSEKQNCKTHECLKYLSVIFNSELQIAFEMF